MSTFMDIKQHVSNGIGCLDTRSLESFNSCHLKNATHINEMELERRLFELPPKNIEFLLVFGSDESAKILKKNGWSKFIPINLTKEEWKMFQKDHNELFSTNSAFSEYIPLFHPCPLLSTHIDEIETSLLSKYSADISIKPNGYCAVTKTSHSVAMSRYNPISSCKKTMMHSIKQIAKKNEKIVFKACDIGCGSGRDSVWLCLRNKLKNIVWNVDCIDNNHKMLSRLQSFSSNTGVSDQISMIKSKIRGDDKVTLYRDIHQSEPFLICDLKKMSIEFTDDSNDENKECEQQYFEKEYDLILCVRFLERSIIHRLWKLGKMLKRNGYLLMYQFMEGCEKTPVGHPKNPNRMLKKGELRKVFGDDKRFKILVDEQVQSEDGRPMQSFLCQRLL